MTGAGRFAGYGRERQGVMAGCQHRGLFQTLAKVVLRMTQTAALASWTRVTIRVFPSASGSVEMTVQRSQSMHSRPSLFAGGRLDYAEQCRWMEPAERVSR